MATELLYAVPDRERLRAFQACVDDYGQGDPGDPWANNCIANDAVAFSNGLIGRAGGSVDLRFNPTELALCRKLAAEAAQVMGPCWPGMYSSSDPVTEPYFVASATLAPHRTIDAALIRGVFGGALYSKLQIEVEPLDESGVWWEQIQGYAQDYKEEDPGADVQTEIFAPWQSVMSWFHNRPELHGNCFVRIGVKRQVGLRGGCVFPWFVLSQTAQGQLVGLSTYLVHG
jgi:hypothetical protein